MVHLLGLGPVLRVCHIMWLGSREKKVPRVEGPYCVNKPEDETYQYLVRKYYERDSSYLNLIDSFIQDGPQLILQLYILLAR